jgi:hypothetical protein
VLWGYVMHLDREAAELLTVRAPCRELVCRRGWGVMATLHTHEEGCASHARTSVRVEGGCDGGRVGGWGKRRVILGNTVAGK